MPKKLFQPGQSGNPGGRPRLPRDLVENAKANSADMLNVLIKLARDPDTPASARISAATAVIDRGFGKPTISVETRQRDVSDLTDAELTRIIRGEGRAAKSNDGGPRPGDDDRVH